jgi:hypothetical protein
MTRPHSSAYRVADRLDVSCTCCQPRRSGLPRQEQQQVSTCSSKFTCDRRPTDENGGCVVNAAYNNHRGNSWLTVDPSNPAHLVGMSKFFFDSFRQRKKGCGCHCNFD